MAGEYYRWLARNEKPEEQKELTPEEKRRNWWDYHKWHVVIVLVCAVLLGDVIYDMVQNSRNRPDYVVAYVGFTGLPDGVQAAVEEGLATLGQDLNGNGKVQVELRQFLLEGAGGSDSMLMYESAEQSMSQSLLLQSNIEMVESMIFLLEDPAVFQALYPILVRPDGTESENLTELYRLWGDCPKLAGLELGTFEIPVIGGSAVGDCQLALEHIAVARRGIWEDGTNDQINGSIELFETIMEGAA